MATKKKDLTQMSIVVTQMSSPLIKHQGEDEENLKGKEALNIEPAKPKRSYFRERKEVVSELLKGPNKDEYTHTTKEECWD